MATILSHCRLALSHCPHQQKGSAHLGGRKCSAEGCVRMRGWRHDVARVRLFVPLRLLGLLFQPFCAACYEAEVAWRSIGNRAGCRC